AENEKQDQLKNQKNEPGEILTTNQGVQISDNQNSLKAGSRGGTLMEDFIFREKMTHFDHERIPERIVHARGSAAHGIFECYESLEEITMAKFLGEKGKKTPVFVRFSTVAGFRGSADTVRDARGFATKFYTDEGNYDLVGNNMPVFFIQDAIKFPDLVHAVKPEPHNEIPQASAAHDNFWDFISLMPESMHMIMWVLSDRALPRSYANMEGFGVHTFRFVNKAGKAKFVKFHWKPKAGVDSLVWDEVTKISGKDPDFNRRQLWEMIEEGHYPEYELGVQMLDEKDEFKFDFDILDATKLWPEEDVPVKIIGKMTLNRNPDNFFAETEQAAFHPGHVVPGIDFTNDPLLQGRLFSYLDTQLIRLGGPNFAEIPINRPVCPVHNNQRDGYGRQTIDKGRVNYEPNSLGGGCPMQGNDKLGAFRSFAEKMEGVKVRERSESFKDHYSQAALFYNSMSYIEQQHIIEGFHFELGKVEHMHIREKMVEHLNKINHDLAVKVAEQIAVDPPKTDESVKSKKTSPKLSQENLKGKGIKTRKVAILAADGVNAKDVTSLKKALEKEGAKAEIISKMLGTLKDADGNKNDDLKVDKAFLTAPSVVYDAVYIPGGEKSVQALLANGDALHFINEAFKHCKPIAATVHGVDLLLGTDLKKMKLAEKDAGVTEDKGVVTSRNNDSDAFNKAFIKAIEAHRHWGRNMKDTVPV
ncbi:MAG: catalase, partial [Bacteroidia bacterium]